MPKKNVDSAKPWHKLVSHNFAYAKYCKIIAPDCFGNYPERAMPNKAHGNCKAQRIMEFVVKIKIRHI